MPVADNNKQANAVVRKDIDDMVTKLMLKLPGTKTSFYGMLIEKALYDLGLVRTEIRMYEHLEISLKKLLEKAKQAYGRPEY